MEVNYEKHKSLRFLSAYRPQSVKFTLSSLLFYLISECLSCWKFTSHLLALPGPLRSRSGLQISYWDPHPALCPPSPVGMSAAETSRPPSKTKEKPRVCVASFLELNAAKPANRLLSSPFKLSSEIREHPRSGFRPKPPHNRSSHRMPEHGEITFIDKALQEGGL